MKFILYTFVLLLILLSCRGGSNKTNNYMKDVEEVEYIFPNDVLISLIKGKNKMISMYKKGVDSLKMFIIIGREDDSTDYYQLILTEKPEVLVLLDLSNRFVQLDKSEKVPIIFEFDLQFASILKGHGTPKFGGYYILVDRQSNHIIKSSFQQ